MLIPINQRRRRLNHTLTRQLKSVSMSEAASFSYLYNTMPKWQYYTKNTQTNTFRLWLITRQGRRLVESVPVFTSGQSSLFYDENMLKMWRHLLTTQEAVRRALDIPANKVDFTRDGVSIDSKAFLKKNDSQWHRVETPIQVSNNGHKTTWRFYDTSTVERMRLLLSGDGYNYDYDLIVGRVCGETQHGYFTEFDDVYAMQVYSRDDNTLLLSALAMSTRRFSYSIHNRIHPPHQIRQAKMLMKKEVYDTLLKKMTSMKLFDPARFKDEAATFNKLGIYKDPTVVSLLATLQPTIEDEKKRRLFEVYKLLHKKPLLELCIIQLIMKIYNWGGNTGLHAFYSSITDEPPSKGATATAADLWKVIDNDLKLMSKTKQVYFFPIDTEYIEQAHTWELVKYNDVMDRTFAEICPKDKDGIWSWGEQMKNYLLYIQGPVTMRAMNHHIINVQTTTTVEQFNSLMTQDNLGVCVYTRLRIPFDKEPYELQINSDTISTVNSDLQSLLSDFILPDRKKYYSMKTKDIATKKQLNFSIFMPNKMTLELDIFCAGQKQYYFQTNQFDNDFEAKSDYMLESLHRKVCLSDNGAKHMLNTPDAFRALEIELANDHMKYAIATAYKISQSLRMDLINAYKAMSSQYDIRNTVSLSGSQHYKIGHAPFAKNIEYCHDVACLEEGVAFRGFKTDNGFVPYDMSRDVTRRIICAIFNCEYQPSTKTFFVPDAGGLRVLGYNTEVHVPGEFDLGLYMLPNDNRSLMFSNRTTNCNYFEYRTIFDNLTDSVAGYCSLPKSLDTANAVDLLRYVSGTNDNYTAKRDEKLKANQSVKYKLMYVAPDTALLQIPFYIDGLSTNDTDTKAQYLKTHNDKYLRRFCLQDANEAQKCGGLVVPYDFLSGNDITFGNKPWYTSSTVSRFQDVDLKPQIELYIFKWIQLVRKYITGSGTMDEIYEVHVQDKIREHNQFQVTLNNEPNSNTERVEQMDAESEADPNTSMETDGGGSAQSSTGPRTFADVTASGGGAARARPMSAGTAVSRGTPKAIDPSRRVTRSNTARTTKEAWKGDD